MSQSVSDYQQVADFWIDASSHASTSMDYVASQDRFMPEVSQSLFRLQQMQVLGRVLNRVCYQPSVLDLACGPGVWAMALAPHVRQLVGVDIAPAFVRHAQGSARANNHHHLEFLVGSMLDFPTTESFDLVMVGAALVYVEDRDLEPLFTRIRSVLAPGGMVYVRTSVAPRTPVVRTRPCTSIYRTREHYESAFRQAGFHVESQRDFTYTHQFLAAAFFAVANALTAGRTFSSPTWGRAFHNLLQRFAPLTFGLGGWLLDLTPAPQCYHFFLRANGAREQRP